MQISKIKIYWMVLTPCQKAGSLVNLKVDPQKLSRRRAGKKYMLKNERDLVTLGTILSSLTYTCKWSPEEGEK